MTLSHLNRRVHLYLGLALLPWLFMYGASSVPFAHTPFFEKRDAAKNLPIWTLRAERHVEAAVPADAEGLRAFGARLLDDAGIHGTSFGVYRQNATQINVYSYSFWESTQIKYFTDTQTMRVEDRRFRWDQFLTGMHARGGFEQDGVLAKSWSVIVDLVCLAIVTWVLSGLWMWWDVRGHRAWGTLTIAAGAVAFVIFTLRL